MDYIRKVADGQLALTQSTDFLKITPDLIKEKLSLAYSQKDEAVMAENIISIMDMHIAKLTGQFYGVKRPHSESERP